jgi:23S rRNA maturation mini-RNase III
MNSQKHQDTQNFNATSSQKGFVKYNALVMKMHRNANTVTQATLNLEVMLGFLCIMPMLEGLNELIKKFRS